MNAELVWNTWRRILRSDTLVHSVVHRENFTAPELKGLALEEIAILNDYASTPIATDTNIGMYRRGLVRNALAALSLVPLSRGLLYGSGLDPEAVAAEFAQSTGYRDDGPYFWKIAGEFIAYLSKLPEFGERLLQDVLELDAAAAALARRLGESVPEVWPERAASTYSQACLRIAPDSIHFVASRAAVVVPSSYDLTKWIENPDDFDSHEHLERSKHYWLIYFSGADAALSYAELSKRCGRAFNLMSTPQSASDLSLAFKGLGQNEVLDLIGSLSELGVIIPKSRRSISRPAVARQVST